MSVPIIIPAGTRFGRIVVQSFHGHNKFGHKMWECLCDCGNVTYASTSSLRNGNKQSCGCAVVEATIKRSTKHGHARRGINRSPEYVVWRCMKDRVTNPNVTGYENYGGRGITISEEWIESFEQFLTDMGSRPSPKHEIERTDNNGPYCKENCIWDTRLNQAQNKRTNVYLTLNGETLTGSEWARRTGLSPATIYYRRKQGWSDEKTLLTPTLEKGGRKRATR